MGRGQKHPSMNRTFLPTSKPLILCDEYSHHPILKMVKQMQRMVISSAGAILYLIQDSNSACLTSKFWPLKP